MKKTIETAVEKLWSEFDEQVKQYQAEYEAIEKPLFFEAEKQEALIKNKYQREIDTIKHNIKQLTAKNTNQLKQKIGIAKENYKARKKDLREKFDAEVKRIKTEHESNKSEILEEKKVLAKQLTTLRKQQREELAPIKAEFKQNITPRLFEHEKKVELLRRDYVAREKQMREEHAAVD
jgi:hypothetical protein